LGCMNSLTKAKLDAMVKGHNGQESQEWGRTLEVKRTKDGGVEVIGVCSFGNLYLVQSTPDGKARIDWIRKSDVGEKHSQTLPEHYRVSDSILDKFRNKL
jgi:hypothetical protein